MPASASASQVSLDRPTARTTISRRLHSRSAAVQKQEMTFHTLKRQLKACSVCCTSDVLANRRNIHHHMALLWRFRDSDAGYKTADLLTYLQVDMICGDLMRVTEASVVRHARR